MGEGPERAALEGLISSLGLQDRVRLLGSRPHSALAACYGAADLMVLASSREGWANVLLESMACGTAVVASDIPGNPEVVGCRDAGLVVPRTPDGIAAGVRDHVGGDAGAERRRGGMRRNSDGRRRVREGMRSIGKRPGGHLRSQLAKGIAPQADAAANDLPLSHKVILQQGYSGTVLVLFLHPDASWR